MKATKVAALLLFVTGLAVAPAPALAWKNSFINGMCGDQMVVIHLAHKWRSPPVVYYVWDTSAPLKISAADAVSTTQVAFTDWENLPDSDYDAMYAGTVTNAKLGNNKNEVFWLATGWNSATGTGPEILGLTYTVTDRVTGHAADSAMCPTMDRCDDSNPCPATESDIFLNADTATLGWAAVGVDAQKARAVLTHEAGHFLGLGHETVAGSDGKVPLMHPMPISSLSGEPYIHRDDADGVKAIYPVGADACEDDDDCVLGDFCSFAGCPVGSYCASGISCPRAEICGEEGACVDHPGERGSPCTTDKKVACGEGLECEAAEGSSRGHCSGPCQNDEDCAPDGRCRAKEGETEKRCIYGGQLPEGQVCDNDDQCVSLACEKNRCAKICEEDCECGGDQACISGACVEGRTSCYYRDGRKDNRALTATLCGARASREGESEVLWPMLFGVMLGGALWVRRRR